MMKALDAAILFFGKLGIIVFLIGACFYTAWWALAKIFKLLAEASAVRLHIKWARYLERKGVRKRHWWMKPWVQRLIA